MLLFPEARTHRPTTRRFAELVRSLGADALPDATRRADEARYQEITCRSALNAVEGMPFRWTLNPYRGCTHACEYCFARRYQRHLELGAGDEFSSLILVKKNFVEVLRRELAAPHWRREQVALGTATDPYQPIEGHYRLTRGTLEALHAASTPVGIVTKGPMVVRDVDLLAEMSRAGRCRVYLSVPTVDDHAWALLEPGTAPPAQRLRALGALRAAGVDAGVLVAPIVPGFTSQPRKLAETFAAAAEHGAAFIGAQVMYLDGGSREHFFAFLRERAPDLVWRYERLYATKHVPRRYANEVAAVVNALQCRFDLQRDEDAVRSEASVSPAAQAPPAQPGFSWEGEPVRREPGRQATPSVASRSSGRSRIASSGETSPSGICSAPKP